MAGLGCGVAMALHAERTPALARADLPRLASEPTGPAGGRLCTVPAGEPASDRQAVHIACAIEVGGRATSPPHASPVLTVAAYNVERGFAAGAQIEAFLGGRGVPLPDVLLVSEADRGCSRTGYRNVMRDYAEALGMHYAFGVEYVELPRESGPGRRIDEPCEHGNGILSRYPIESPRVVRFGANKSWYQPPAARATGEPRFGGRMALAATIRAGGTPVEVYSLHLESHPLDGAYRRSQVEELARDVAAQPWPAVVGGDFNLHPYLFDLLLATRLEPAIERLQQAGLFDAHRRLPALARRTHIGLVAVDLIFTPLPVLQAGIGPAAEWGGLSDHLPVWSRLLLPARANPQAGAGRERHSAARS